MKPIGYRAAITWLANDARTGTEAWLMDSRELPQAARMVSDEFEVNEEQVRGDVRRKLALMRKAG